MFNFDLSGIFKLIEKHLPGIMKEGDEPFCAKCLKAFKKRIKGLIKQEEKLPPCKKPLTDEETDGR